MERLELKHKEIVEFCLANSDESVIKKYSRYFKKGYDAYGIDSNMIVTQKTKWLSSWEDEMTIYDYLNLGDTLVSTGKLKKLALQSNLFCQKKRNFPLRHSKELGNG